MRITLNIGVRALAVALGYVAAANACMTSAFGPEFDKHVIVETLDESRRKFRVSVPSVIEDRNVETAWLAYYERPFHGFDQPRLPVHYDEVELKRERDQFVGEFTLEKLEPHLYATIRINLDGLCGATAQALVPPS